MDGDLDGGLTLAEAAARLGVQPDAVRKRAKRGTLRSARAADGTLRVWLPDKPASGQTADPGREEMAAHIASLKLELERRAEEIRRRDVILAQMTDQLKALRAPDTVPPPDRSPAVDRPVWWRRLFWGPTGKPSTKE